MQFNACLHLPRPALGACIYLGVERDTRGLQFTDAQRFNYYPATPLPAISWTFQGDLHMVEESTLASAVPSLTPALPRVVLAGPHRKPSASWSPGAVHALLVSFYPEALSALLDIDIEPLVDKIVPLDSVVSGPLLARLLGVGARESQEPFHQIEAMLQPLWREMHDVWALPTLHGWLQSLAVRAAFTKSGAGIRRAQRRFKDWTGQSYRDLQLFVRTERAMAHAAAQPQDTAPDLASLAAQAGFADQSHLGREVRRVTGIPPGRLGELMRTEEAFWFYRLMSEHFRYPAGTRPSQARLLL
jgi:AraC-like DNA-binding protein